MIKKTKRIKLINKNTNEYIDDCCFFGSNYKERFIFFENFVLLVNLGNKKNINIFVNNNKINSGIILVKIY